MSYSQAVFLAIIQGLTEFLPVSSSGHLVIFQKLFGLKSPILFDVLVHVGTLGAVIVFLRGYILKVIRGLIKRDISYINISYTVLVGTVPVAVVGFFLQGIIGRIFDSLQLVGISLLVTAGLLFSTKLVKENKRRFKYLVWVDGLVIGLFQALAILPGISRSGSTIVAGLWRRLDREVAFQFSFLLAIPAILGALILQIPDLFFSSYDYLNQSLLGMVIAGLVGYLALTVLEKTVKKARFSFFSFYCLLLGALLLLI